MANKQIPLSEMHDGEPADATTAPNSIVLKQKLLPKEKVRRNQREKSYDLYSQKI